MAQSSCLSKRFWDLCDDDTDEQMVAMFWFQMAQISLSSFNVQSGGSLPGKSGNIKRDYEAGHLHYTKKYFWPETIQRPGTNDFGPEQPEHVFERRFRMPRVIFNRVMATCISQSTYIRQGLNPDCTGRIGITPLIKIICALKMISYGLPADMADDMFDISETTANLCLESFCAAVMNGLGFRYLRDPTAEDIARIERSFAAAGFPGCIGCLDCAGWGWKNCPVALQGIMKGKSGKAEIRMEVICDLDLWIWSFQFGLPGAFNDLNILETSNHFAKVLSGSFPPVSPKYRIDGNEFNWFYYLTDGIYPEWRIFIQSIQDSTNRKDKHFSSAQEAIRKSVERVFGVLFKRFKLLFVACEYWSVDKMKSIATTAVILHNMIVEARRSSYTSDGTAGRSRYFDEDEESNEIDFIHCSPGSTALFENSNITISDDIKIRGMHRDLKKALVEHQWNLFGGS